MLLEAALHYLDGFTGGPESRAKTGPQKPYNGSIWPYAYIYFAEPGHVPTYDISTMTSNMPRNNVGWFPWSSYRPLKVINAIANRDFTLPVEIQSAKPFYHLDHDNYGSWKGDGSYDVWKTDKSTEEENHRTGFRYEFESIYMDTNYLLASLATYRPNGSLGTFSEHNLFRLVVKGSDAGAIQVMGNTGFSDTPAKRDPYEQIGQYGNVMMRVSKNPDASYNQFWFGIPKIANRVVSGNRLFVNMGQGVYFAILPLNTPTLANESYDTDHEKYTWSYGADELAAVVMEVGTVADHGGFSDFQDAFASLTVGSPATDEVEYTSTSGQHLRMQWTGIVDDYPLTQDGGSILTTAGTIPRTWRDGTEVDYNSWNAYETVQGEEILRQNWGSGLLRMVAGGEAIEIEIDPDSGEATYYTTPTTPNTPPSISTDAAADPATINLSDTTSLTVTASDPDGDTLTYTWSKTSGPGTVTITPNGTSASNSATASFSEVGDYTLRATVDDGRGGTVTSSVNVTVNADPNTPPSISTAASADPTSINLSDTTSLSVTASDPDGDTLTYTWSKTSGPGTVTITPNGTSTSDSATASFSAVGDYTLRVTVDDDRGGTATSSVNVTVNADPNRNPVIDSAAVADPSTISIGGTSTLTVTASDPDGDTLTYTWSKTSGPGTVTITPNGTSTSDSVTAGFDATGEYEIEVLVEDGNGGTATDTVTVIVTEQPNDPPTIDTPASATPDTIQIGESTTLAVTASDPDGDTLTYTWSKVSGPGTLTVSPNGTGADTSTATFGAVGNYELQVRVADGNGGSATSTVTVTVNGDPGAGDGRIGISGNNVAIADGDTTPDIADGTDFGATYEDGSTVVRGFTISNTGTATLLLTGSPAIAVSGDFSVTQEPATAIAAGESTTFEITFDPSSAGAKNATVIIESDDSTLSSFDFAVAGEGLAGANPGTVPPPSDDDDGCTVGFGVSSAHPLLALLIALLNLRLGLRFRS